MSHHPHAAWLAASGLALALPSCAASAAPADHPRTYLWAYYVIPEIAVLEFEWQNPLKGFIINPADTKRFNDAKERWHRLADEIHQMRPDLCRVPYFLTDYWWGPGTRPPVPPRRIPEMMAIQKAVMQEHFTAYGILSTPYICAVKIAGDPQARTGIWGLYDHWEEYADVLDLGPKPKADPKEWLQRPTGWQYETFVAYLGSLAHPAYRRFKAAVVRTLARAGCTGLFIDNPFERATSPDHQERFRQRLQERYPPPLRRAMFGTDDVSRLSLGATESFPASPLDVETWMDQWHRTALFFREMKEAGASVHGPGSFPIAANGTPIDVRPHQSGSLETWAAGGVNIGFAERRTKWLGDWNRPLGGGFSQREHEDHIPGYLACRGVGEGELYCSPEWNPAIQGTSLTYRLTFAEALAFDGVFMDMQPAGTPPGEPHPTRADRHRWFAWLREHRGLFAGEKSAASIALVTPSTEFLINPQFELEWTLWLQTLLEHQVPTDLLMGNNLRPESLGRHELVILPCVSGLEEADARVLQEYVRQGGRLIVVGEAGTRYPNGALRQRPLLRALLPQRDTGGKITRRAVGRGRVWYSPRPLSVLEWPAEFNLPAYSPPLYHRYGGKRYSHTAALIRQEASGAVLDLLETAMERTPSVAATTTRGGLRVHLYDLPGTPPRRTLHFVNHSVQVSLHEAPIAFEWQKGTTPHVKPVVGFDAMVPLPPGMEAKTVRWHSPDSASQEMPFTNLSGAVRFTTPSFEIYGVAEILLQQSVGGNQAPPRHVPRSAPEPVYHVDRSEMERLQLLAPNAPTEPEPGTFTLRANHQFLIRVTQGEMVKAHITGRRFEEPANAPRREQEKESLDIVSEGGIGFARVPWVAWWLIGPDGRPLARGSTPIGQVAEVRAQVREAGVVLLHVDAGNNEAEVSIENRTAVLACRDTNRVFAHTVQRPLYFYVRRGAKEVPLYLGTYDSQADIILTSPTGRQIQRKPPDPRIVAPLKVNVEPGEDGGIWQLRLQQKRLTGPFSTVTFYVDDPDFGYVSDAPGRLLGRREE